MGWSPYRKTGLTYHAPGQSLKGYTLVTPAGGGDSSFLLDMAGRIVHRWRFETLHPFYARLLPSRNLLANGIDVGVTPPVVPPGTAPTFQQPIRRMGGNAA